ncbi:MAG TPA: discoidin domain-containing protein, partial [Pirellulaceae bacterium]|nr:discoidin domain-containing protein [Pirellulaceae bacterium]
MICSPLRFVSCLALGIALLTASVDRASAADDKKAVAPIRALLITGGCCHDYTNQKKILPEAISAKANVTWTIVHQGGTRTDAMIPFYEKDDWAKGFDIVVHNECFAAASDPAWTAKILKPHREGTPALVVHCAMHCYRDKTDEWFKFLGVTSRGHGANYPFEIVNLEPKDPIMAGFGEKWNTPKGELYIIEKLWPTAKPLAHAMSRDTKKNEVCLWTNMYNGQTRVFGTTIGHHNEEMSDPVFVNYMTRGLLWACDKLNDDYLVPCKDPKFEMIGDPVDNTPKKMGEPTPAKKPESKTGMKVLRPKNLALKKPATANSVQVDGSVNHKPENATDGDLSTRWCPTNANVGYWWQVDLGQPEELKGVRLTWEMDDANYRYKVEGSADGQKWQMLSDQSQTKDTAQEREHKFEATGIRYVRITTTGLKSGAWGSFFECEVLGKEMVETIVQADNAPKTIGGKNLLAGIKAPAGFKVSLFAAPPQAGYPTCLAVAPSGAVFIGIDENGSLDAKANRGRVVRAVDTDGDGAADEVKTFATMDSPRGLVFDNNTLYVQHPPYVTAFHDDNGDGVSDRSEVLVEGLGFDLKFRGADHTTNGMQLGIDGFLYIAVGDYGYIKAKAKDGTELQLLGGGVTRVRTDGSGLEIVSRGQRNIYDVAVDPLLNLFTRDNTNDGGGWNVRLSHVIPSGQYGYPSLYINFPEEIVQPLADYGGGSPCGSLFIDEGALPAPFGKALYTCDWGRSVIYRHPLTHVGAGYEAQQEPFLELPRPTDMEVDASGNIYVASWRDGGFSYSGPNVGYVVRVAREDAKSTTFPDLTKVSSAELVKLLGSGSHVARIHTQREI